MSAALVMQMISSGNAHCQINQKTNCKSLESFSDVHYISVE